MKKLKLNLANLQGTEVLTREQLKKVMGGDMESGAGSGGLRCSSSACSGTDVLIGKYNGTCALHAGTGPVLDKCECKLKNGTFVYHKECTL